MAYTSEVVCGIWTGAWVTLDGQLHRGSVALVTGNLGDVRTDCGREGLGYLAGDDPNALCSECARLNR